MRASGVRPFTLICAARLHLADGTAVDLLDRVGCVRCDRVLIYTARGHAAEAVRGRGRVAVPGLPTPSLLDALCAPAITARRSPTVHDHSRRELFERGRWLADGGWAVVDAVLDGNETHEWIAAAIGVPREGLKKRIGTVLEAFDANTLGELKIDLESGAQGVGPYGSRG